MVGFVMSTGEEKPTLARDAMYGVVMLVFNGFMGLSLVLGGLRHGEQRYNLFGANAFLIMILPLSVLGLSAQLHAHHARSDALDLSVVLLSVMSVGIYGISCSCRTAVTGAITSSSRPTTRTRGSRDARRVVALDALPLTDARGVRMPLVMLAKQMSTPLDAMVSRLGAPVALGGFVLATLVLTPESIAAVKAAYANRLQRSINILGSVLAAIGLTIPLVIVISLATGRRLELGLDPAETVMLVLTLATAGLTFALPDERAPGLHSPVAVRGAYLMLMFD